MAAAAVAMGVILCGLRGSCFLAGSVLPAPAQVASGCSGVAMMATVGTDGVRTIKLKKGEKYRGQVNPKLRALLEATEYRQLVDLLSRLESQGLLTSFLGKSEEYWAGVNLLNLAMEEQQGGGKAMMKTLRQDWNRIWPEQLEAERLPAFDLFSAFWKRLDQSRLMDTVMGEVLPDMKNGYNDLMNSQDQKKLMEMSDEQRRDEILRRLGNSDIICQYAILSENDVELKTIGPKMAPFIARFVSLLERKVASQTAGLGILADASIFGGAILALLLILVFVGVLKLPSFGDEAPQLQSTAPTNFQALVNAPTMPAATVVMPEPIAQEQPSASQ